MTSDSPAGGGSILSAADPAKAIRTAGLVCLAAAALRGLSYLLVWIELSGPAGHVSIKGYQDTNALAYLFVFFLGFSGVQALISQNKQARGGLVFWGIAAAGWSIYNTMQITSDGRKAMAEFPGLVFEGSVGLWVYAFSGFVALLAGFLAFRARHLDAPAPGSAPPPAAQPPPESPSAVPPPAEPATETRGDPTEEEGDRRALEQRDPAMGLIVKEGVVIQTPTQARAKPQRLADRDSPDVSVAWLYVAVAGFFAVVAWAGFSERLPIMGATGLAAIAVVAVICLVKRT